MLVDPRQAQWSAATTAVLRYTYPGPEHGFGMAVGADSLPIETVSLLALVGAALLTVLALRRLEGPGWSVRLRSRFILGVPWGTCMTVAGLVGVYLLLQVSGESLTNPLVVPFRAWSYEYPLGMLLAPFSHSSLSHITGNLLATVVFASVAEYAWSHFPTARGSHAFASYRTNPYFRVLAFVVGVFLVGVSTSLFVPGPLIGFSGVVFACAGFALVTMPLLAIFAIVAERVVSLAYTAVQDPVMTAEASTRFVEPWWAHIAVQGHAFGLLVGILLGATVARRRDTLPRARYVWFGTLVFAVFEALYAVYWYGGANRYVLYRAAGTAGVLVLAILVATAIAGSDRQLVPRLDISSRTLAGGFVLAVVLAIGVAAVPYNVVDVEGADPADGVSVRDYTVVYDEDVSHGYTDAVTIPFVGTAAAERAGASGVIVTSDRRNAWEQVVPAGELAFDGRSTVWVGGLGWRERVVANRTAWNAVDAGSTYKVYLHSENQPRHLSYTSDPVRLAPTVGGLNFSIEPTAAGYRLNATRNGSVVGRGPVPSVNETVRFGAVSVSRTGPDLVLAHEGTRIRVAEYQLRTRPDE